MSIQFECVRHDLTTLGLNPSATGLVPKAGSVYLRRKGATVRTAGAIGGPGSAAVEVSDVGSLVPGDVVQVNAAGTTGTVNLLGYTRQSINIAWSGAVTWPLGSRLVLTGPNIGVFGDPFAVTPIAQPVAFGASSGLASVYTRVPEVDFVRTVDAVTDVLVDQAGLGGRQEISPLDWDAAFDGTTNDATAFQSMFLVAQARGATVIQLPPGTALIGTSPVISGVTGIVVRGAGKGITRFLFSTNIDFLSFSACTDVVFEDMTIGRTVAGAAYLLSNLGTNVRVGFRRCHFTKGARIILDDGVDTFFEECSADGDGWTGGFYFLGATRPVIRRFVGRLAATFATPFIDLDLTTTSPRFTDLDIKPDGAFSFPVMRVRNSGGPGVAGPTDVQVTSPHFISGVTYPCIEVISPSAGGDHPAGITFRDSQCEDSLRAIDVSGGRGVRISGLRSIGMANESVYLKAGAGAVTIDHVESSHVGGGGYHIRVAGSVSDVDISHILGGNFLRAAAGALALAVVGVEDGTGANVFVGPSIHRTNPTDVQAVVLQSKYPGAAQRTQIHMFHNQGESSPSVTSEHDGVVFYSRTYINDSTTPSVEGVGALELNYGVGISVTDFIEGRPGQVLFITNMGANSITLVHALGLIENTGAVAVVLLSGETVAYYKSKNGSKGWLQVTMVR